MFRLPTARCETATSCWKHEPRCSQDNYQADSAIKSRSIPFIEAEFYVSQLSLPFYFN